MKKCTKFGHEFEYEKIMPEKFKEGPCAFRVKDSDGNTMYWAIIPEEMSDDREIATPNDGILCAASPDEGLALIVASSICIATHVANIEKRSIKSKVESLAKDFGFDLEKLDAEVKRLKAEGKSPKEIEEVLKPRMDEFKRADAKADAKQEGGEW